MGSVNSKDIPMEFRMFGELFNLRKEFYTPEDNDEYWKKMFASFDALCRKYPTEYCKDLALATVKDFENRYKAVIVVRKKEVGQ